MRCGASAAVALLLVAACSAPGDSPIPERPDFETLRSVCTDDDDAPTWPLGREGLLALVSQPCAETAGKVIGLEWASFDDAPTEFGAPDTLPRRLVAGVLIAVLAFPGRPHSLANANAPATLRHFAGRNLDEEEAGEAWFKLLQSQIDQVVAAEDLGGTVAMAYDEGTVLVNLATLGEVGDAYIYLPLFDTAGALVHEATHGLPQSGHVDCPGDAHGRACDVDWNAALGAEAWWGMEWFDAHHGDLSYEYCTDVADSAQQPCARIFNDGAFPPCVRDLYHSCVPDP